MTILETTPAPNPPQPTGWPRGVTRPIVAVVVVLGLCIALYSRSQDDAEPVPPEVRAFGGVHPCVEPVDGQPSPPGPETIDEFVQCIEWRPTADWPVGVFGPDGRGYLVEHEDGDVVLRSVGRCDAYRGSRTEAVDVMSLGTRFRARGNGSRWSIGPNGKPFPGPDADLSAGWQGDGLVDAVFELHSCGLPLADAVALIEPLARAAATDDP